MGLFLRATYAVVTAPRSPKASLDLVPRGNKRFRRGEQQESFVTLMTGSFGRMGNLELVLFLSFFLSLLSLSLSLSSFLSPSIGQKLASLFIEMKYLCTLRRAEY